MGREKQLPLLSFRALGCPRQCIFNHCPASELGRCPPHLGNLSCFSCWNRSVCTDLPSFEPLPLGQAESCSLTRGGMAEMDTLLPDLGPRSRSEKTLPGLLGWAAHLNAPVTSSLQMNTSFWLKFSSFSQLEADTWYAKFWPQQLKTGKVKRKRNCDALMESVRQF